MEKNLRVTITCNIVTTCLSPVLVQIGAMPNFTATKPTLRLPEARFFFKKKTAVRTGESFIHSFRENEGNTPCVHACRCQGSSLSGHSFSAVCLLNSWPRLFLMYSWLSSVRCSSNHVMVFAVLAHPATLKALETNKNGKNKDRVYKIKAREQIFSSKWKWRPSRSKWWNAISKPDIKTTNNIEKGQQWNVLWNEFTY